MRNFHLMTFRATAVLQTVFVLVIFLMIASCRFVVPGSSETAALGQRGAFSGGAPAWAKSTGDGVNTLPSASGIMPRTHTVPKQVSLSSTANASTATQSAIGRGLPDEREALAGDSSAAQSGRSDPRLSKREVSKQEEKPSPILSLEKNCPGSERAVVDALKTELVSERIKKYLVLTRQCPSSPEVWTWLARDYYNTRRFSDARRCIQAALAIDPDNEDAKSLQDEMLKSGSYRQGSN
ncbi:MAG TPA: tetratricopeptide repeat protein [Oligoflexia bacterium]|nr:tetratricopeptide repeat protein [Oligoflexia bacterium]HMP47489.1 tetratricopeptide repeat protein [Oligoflexia bacterium]